MSPKITTAAVGGCLLAFAFGLAWFAHRSACIADVSLADLAKKRAALESAIRRVEPIAAADWCRGRGPAVPGTPGTLATTLPAAVTDNRPVNYAQLAAVDSRFAALLLKAFRANLAGQFGSFYRALNLTPDQIVKFEDLIVENHAEMMDVAAVASSQGLKSDNLEMAAAMQQPAGQLRSALVAMLGESGYQQLAEFSRAGPVATIVNKVALSVAFSSSPLTGSQIDSLARILAHASSRFQSGGPADPATIDWAVAMDQAQSVLSGPQLVALKMQHESAQIGQMVAQFNQEEAAVK